MLRSVAAVAVAAVAAAALTTSKLAARCTPKLHWHSRTARSSRSPPLAPQVWPAPGCHPSRASASRH